MLKPEGESRHRQPAALGVRALVALADDFQLDDLRSVADELIRRTEAGMRAGIAALPDGRYEKEMLVEIAGVEEPQRIAVAVTIQGDELTTDFTGTSLQVRRPVNSPINYTRAYVVVPIKMVCDPDLPNNEGTYRAIDLVAPEGCLVNPTYPAACFWRLSVAMLVAELMFRVLGEIAPDRVPADSGSMPTWQFYVAGLRPDGGAFSLHQHAFGGMGARPGRDGLASVSFPYNVRDVSIEWSEMETPLFFERRELLADSGGAGQWRGGLGEELVLRTFADHRLDPARSVVLSGSAGRMRFPPQGVLGGRPGSLGVIEVNGRPIAPTSSPEVVFRHGDVLRLVLPGGAGYGDPRARDHALVAADLRNGYITAAAARGAYGYDRSPS
jgi:N-methylhydantoinase B